MVVPTFCVGYYIHIIVFTGFLRTSKLDVWTCVAPRFFFTINTP